MNLESFADRQAQRLIEVPDQFIVRVARSQQQIFNRINALFSSLERDGDGIIMSETNMQIAEEIRNALPGIFEDSKYVDAVAEFVSEFDKQKLYIDRYMISAFGDSAMSDFADAVLERTKANATDLLASSTVKTNFLKPLEQQIDLAVQTGQSFRETVKQLRTYATGPDIAPGAQYAGRDLPGGKLVQYSKEIAYDSIAISDRAYTNALATELKSEWYFYAGGILPTTRKFCADRVGKYYHYKEIESWASDKWGGKMQNTNAQNIFALLGGYNCQHTLIPVTIDQVPADVIARNIANGNFEETKQTRKIITEARNKEVKEFPRDGFLEGADQRTQEKSIEYFVDNKLKLASDYIERFGNVASADEARKLFKVVGYTGGNSAAVQEASSALNKLVQKVLVERGEMNNIVMYAGGSGSGKSSTIARLFKDIKKTADVVIDGNMSTYAKSIKQIDAYLSSGKTVNVIYVYRDPVDAWINGVIKRMLENPDEGGRVVPLRIFLDNTEGSYNTIKELLKFKTREGIHINLIDNSLGIGKQEFMSIDKFNSIDFESSLREKLIKETQKLLDAGKITKEQFDKLINS